MTITVTDVSGADPPKITHATFTMNRNRLELLDSDSLLNRALCDARVVMKNGR